MPAKLKICATRAEQAGRDPMAIVPANIIMCLIGDDDEVDRDARAAAGQVDPADADRRGTARSSATSIRWGRTGAAIRTSIRAC